MRGLRFHRRLVQAGHHAVVAALGVFNLAHQHLALVAHALQLQQLGALGVQLTAHLGFTLLVDGVGNAHTPRDAAHFGIDAAAQFGDVGFGLHHLRVVVAKLRVQLLQPRFIAGEVGLQATDQRVVQHLLRAVGLRALGLGLAAAGFRRDGLNLHQLR